MNMVHHSPLGPGEEIAAQALAAERSGSWMDAIEYWQRIISRAPLSGSAWLGFGRASLKAGQISDGVTGFRVAAQYHEGDVSFRKHVMQEAAAVGLWPIVTAMADGVQNAEFRDPASLLCRAEAHFRLNRLALANQTITQALTGDPANQKALTLRAQIERLTNRIDVGHAALRTILGSEPTNGAARAELIFTSIRQQKIADAQRLLDDHPGPADTSSALLVAQGMLAEHRKDFFAALDFYKRALAIDDTEVEALSQGANLCLRRLADPGEAFKLACRLADVAPVATTSALLYADACEAVGRTSQAIDRLQDFLKVFPDDSRVALRLARLLLEVGEPSAARTVVSKFTSNRATAFKLTHALAQAAAKNWRDALEELHGTYTATNIEELVRALRQLMEMLPDTALIKAVANTVVAKWATPVLGFRMFEETLARGQIEQSFEWARALLLWNPAKYSAAEVAKIVDAARLHGYATLAESWSSWLPAAADTTHLEADGMIERREYAQVVDASLSSLTEAPTDKRTWERLIIGLVLLSRFEEAAKILADSKRRMGTPAELSRFQFELFVIRGDAPAALDMVRGFATTAIHPNAGVDLLARMLGEYLRSGDVGAAERLLETLAAATVSWIEHGFAGEAIVHYLRLLARHGDGREFDRVSKVAVARNFHPPQFLDVLGEYYSSEGFLEESLASTVQAIELEGDRLDRRQREAALLVRMNRWPEALQSTTQLLQKYGVQQRTLDLYVQALSASNDLAAAESALRLSIHLWPTALPVIRRFAAHFSTNGLLEAEIRGLRRHCDLYPRDLAACLQLAVCLEQHGEWSAADATFSSLMGTRLYDLSVLEAHVRLRYLRMHYNGAQELIARFDLARPMIPQSARRVSALHRLIYNGPAAGRLLRRAMSSGSGNPAIGLALLEHVVADGSIAEASDLLEPILAADPLNARIFYTKGMNHYNVGDMEAAKAAFASAVFLNRNFLPALTQLALIEEEALNFDSALRAYDRIMEVAKRTNQNPGGRAHWHLVTVLMITGQYQKAVLAHTAMSESLNSAFPDGASIWRGESLKDRQLVVAMRGGPGDELRIASLCFRDKAITSTSRCTFACDPRLYTLLSRSYPEIEFIPTYSGHRQLRRSTAGMDPLLNRVSPNTGTRIVEMAVPFDRFAAADYVCHSDALFHQTFFEGVLAEGRALKSHFVVPSSERRREMRIFLDSLGAGPKVGLSWRGSYVSRYRDRVFLGIGEIEEILRVEGVQFIDLQPSKTAEETAVLGAANVHSVPGLDLYDDFEGMAALMSELDLVLTPGTTIRDVSAAVGTPTWSFTMSPGAGDVWRRLDDGRDRWQSAIMHYDLISHGSRQKAVTAVAEHLAEFRDTAMSARRPRMRRTRLGNGV